MKPRQPSDESSGEDMWHNAHDAYLESRVLSAGPVELVRLLYGAATASVRDARRYLEAGDVASRSRAITKAGNVLLELTASLDFERGGDIAQRLASLYCYMLRRLTEANFQQADAPLGEVLGLLATLSEGWEGIRDPQNEPEAAPCVPPSAFQSGASPVCSTRDWSC
jgi:flagellar secretion chaperone FliS